MRFKRSCIPTRYDERIGILEPDFEDTPQSWYQVRNAVKAISVIDPLVGWGDYCWLVKITFDFTGQDYDYYYMVTGEEKPKEKL